MKKLLLSILFLIACSNAHAATTWYACSGGGNWNGASVWTSILADEVGCTASTGNPVAGDTAILNSNSGNITITSAAAAAILNETGYTGTLAFSTFEATISGLCTIQSAMTSTSGILSCGGGITLAATPTGTFPLLFMSSSGTFTPAGFTWPGVFAATNGATVTAVGAVIVGTLENYTSLSAGAGFTIAGAYGWTVSNFYINPVGASNRSWTFPASQTLTVTNSIQYLGQFVNSTSTITIKSGTSSTAFNLVYTGTTSNENISEGIFTDVNATGSTATLSNYFGGTLTRTTNITNVNASNIGGSSTASQGYIYGG